MNLENPTSPESATPYQLRNLLVAIAAIVLTAALFFGFQVQQSGTSLDAVAAAALPIDVALANNKPTTIEFYADWCTSCQSMAADNLSLEKEYSDRMNFVMLNVDNTKWLPEMTKYRVDGIPRFIFLDPANKAIGDSTGAIPREIMAANIEAAIADRPLPYNSTSSDRISPVTETQAADISQPRDHGKKF
ncbi:MULTISPECIES: thioredoxin domain-containing protein [Pseudanabaena]|uniref:Thioredoxin domain-containing protein n=2 Tax=Pseudanabaena TaxID=1152 RepID=L8MZ12_9CYAN|nr:MULTISPECIES: thioredoxin domain-containing protein [Pseudanabaena]ELS33222.1 Thioredoxin domain-containing protein [Pseudanabaena biceps PCC 7429]MDG3494565.1 thioredoxin domain-containing protein [Pseudanabaena catenata USMAC16]